jgi:ParB family chromosome partitioning protein
MAKEHNRRALGRGLSALIQPDTEEKGTDGQVMMVDINTIKPNPFQPRIEFDETEIKGLAESIRIQGLLQPIVLRKKVDGYEIISGERRFRALKSLGNDKVPCIVKPKVNDREMLELALVENIQREQLNELEEATAYQRLLLECGLSHESLSERVGKSRSTITNMLRLLKLPEKIQDLLRKKQISMGHARALLSVENPEQQMTLALQVVSDHLSVRDVESSVSGKPTSIPIPENSAKPEKEIIPPKRMDPDLVDVIERIRYRFGTHVDLIQQKNDKGKIEISYSNSEDLSRVVELLLK